MSWIAHQLDHPQNDQVMLERLTGAYESKLQTSGLETLLMKLTASPVAEDIKMTDTMEISDSDQNLIMSSFHRA